MRCHPHRVRGFSLIELLFAVAVVAVLAALAAPALTDFQADQARSRAASEFLASLMRARSQAITQGRSVFLCPRASTADNTPACTTSADWSNGLLIVNTTTTPAAGVAVPDSIIVWEYAPTDPSVRITRLANSGTAPTAPVRFSAVGSIGNGNLALWSICRAASVRQVTKAVGSTAVLQFNGNASLEPKSDCPTS